MNNTTAYIVDADVLITAKNLYYAFDICPGFWDCLVRGCQSEALRSIDKVQQELLMGHPEEDLVLWVNNDLPASFFLDTVEPDVIAAFSEVMQWVQSKPQYYPQAKAAFATKADGWLVAYAMVYGVSIATNEQPAPNSRKEVKLPDVCEEFDVSYEDTFAMLRKMQTQFELR